MLKLSLITLIFLPIIIGQVNTEENNPKKYPLENLNWMVGHWQGEAFGGVCEEIWSPPSGGSMTGTFKLFRLHVPFGCARLMGADARIGDITVLGKPDNRQRQSLRDHTLDTTDSRKLRCIR